MPVITITLIRGYPDAVKTRLCEKLTDAAMAVIAASAEGVTVMVNEVEPAGYMRGRQPKVPGAAPQPPAELCLDFLAAMGARELDRATAMTAEGFAMIFPGGQEFTNWDGLLAWAAPRYCSIAKRIDRVEEAPLGETVAVYISGTLAGERPDGTPFEGIRFIDRFETRAGKILRQEVWNDMGESLFAQE